jgi:probable phosphoglycerate mutase
MTGRRVVLWRHGQTIWNVEQRYQGQSDIPLDETGVAQALRAARLLAALEPSKIVSSDLVRAAATAEPLSRLTGLPIQLDSALRERGGGEWEGLTNPEIRARWPHEHTLWEPPGGESSEQVAKRVGDALERATADLSPRGLAVVASHGAALRLGMLRLLGLPEDVWGRLGGLANCCWSVLEEGRVGWRLTEHNAGTLPEPVMSDDRQDP